MTRWAGARHTAHCQCTACCIEYSLTLQDGSSYYKIHHNCESVSLVGTSVSLLRATICDSALRCADCVFGGHKSDFDGNSKISSYNLAVFPSVYGSKCFGELQFVPPPGFAEGCVSVPSNTQTTISIMLEV